MPRVGGLPHVSAPPEPLAVQTPATKSEKNNSPDAWAGDATPCAAPAKSVGDARGRRQSMQGEPCTKPSPVAIQVRVTRRDDRLPEEPAQPSRGNPIAPDPKSLDARMFGTAPGSASADKTPPARWPSSNARLV